ncbi:small, acid-soluble spore protein L [Sporosarcina sp. FSL K6-1522]
MAKSNNRNKGKKATSVTPQGNGNTEFAQEPTTKLENAAKKKNTK